MYHCPICDPNELEALGYRCTKCRGYFAMNRSGLVGLTWDFASGIRIYFDLDKKQFKVYRCSISCLKFLFKFSLGEESILKLLESLNKKALNLIAFS